MEQIQWYPGHMAKTRRLIEENLKLVDIVVELLDARAPLSSKNADIDGLLSAKPRLTALNKADLADPESTRAWLLYFGRGAVSLDSLKGGGTAEITAMARSLTKEKTEREKGRGRLNVKIRAMILGIPNVGKSTLINKYAGSAKAKAENRPGVTRTKQWVKIGAGFELLDIPGILPPKFDDPSAGVRLALIGSIKDDILDIYALSLELIDILRRAAPDALPARYKITDGGEDSAVLLEKIAKGRGFVKKGGAPDAERAAAALIDEFRSGRLGRITLEPPPG
ncbi:MAG: ribosome biogenesis GTPase YlqF [Clostridiales bacterium]|jgi:ribosome biogenesis GTPase A|nr:ribosome biogenesis GTPase YlqF [Clostridiales bacterium]